MMSNVSTASGRGRWSVRKWAPIGVVAALLILVFSRTLLALWHSWQHNPNYSHGFLIVPISLGIIWLKRKEIAAVRLAPSWTGFWLIGCSLAVFVLGMRMDTLTFQGYALLGTLAGLALYAGGGRLLKALGFPIGYLLFMLPFPPWFVHKLSFGLKLLAARGSCGISRSAGIPLMEDGMSLYFSSGTMKIENACSGMQSLIALLSLGALFAYFSHGSWWKRGLLFLLAVPIALLSNIIRITALCFVANFSSVATATGLFHEVSGFVLFAFAFLALLGSKKVLRC
jgi:exosortase